MIKQSLILSLFLVCACSASGQFTMVSSGVSWTTVNDSTYSATVNFYSDLTGKSYNPTQIADTFLVYSANEQVYRISARSNQFFSSADLTIIEQGGDWGSPVGQVCVYDPNGRNTVPEAVFATNGAGAQLLSAISRFNARQIGTGGSGGGTSLTSLQVRDSLELLPDSSKLAGTAVRTLVPIFDVGVESNAGAQGALNSALSAAELAARPGVEMLNPYAQRFETLNIGAGNHLWGHFFNDLSDSLRASTVHGVENGIANEMSLYGGPVKIIKTGQGGSNTTLWEPGDTFATLAKERIRLANRLLKAKNQQGAWTGLVFWGINDAILGTDTIIFKNAVYDLLIRKREWMSYDAHFALVRINEMGAGGNAYLAYDRQFIALANQYDWIHLIETSGLSKTDNNHWDKAGIEEIAKRFGVIVRDTIGLPYGRGSIANSVQANTVNVMPYSTGSNFGNTSLIYSLVEDAIYKGPVSPTNSNYMLGMREGDAGIYFRSLIGSIPVGLLVNHDAGSALALIAGSTGNTIAYDRSLPYQIVGYEAGSIESFTFTDPEISAQFDGLQTGIRYLTVGSLVGQEVYALQVVGRSFMTEMARMRGNMLVGDSSLQEIPILIGSRSVGATQQNNILNLKSNVHGSLIWGLNFDFSNYNSNVLINPTTHPSAAGTGFIIKGVQGGGDGNNQSIHAYVSAPAAVVSGDTITITPLFSLDPSQRVGISNEIPSARLHLPAGGTNSSDAPLKFTSGSLNTVPEAGAMEFQTDRWYGTNTSGVRKGFAWLDEIVTNSAILNQLPKTDASGNLIFSAISDNGSVVTIGTRLGLALGTAVSPTLTFTTDDDTGIYSPAANEIGISTGGIEGLRVDANQDVIILNTIWLDSGKTIGVFTGSGSPESSVTASPGSRYYNTTGGAGTTFYVKETGTGNTGWVAK